MKAIGAKFGPGTGAANSGASGLWLAAVALGAFVTPVSTVAAEAPSIPSTVRAAPDDTAVQEVIVTAQKVAQNLQKTPLAISAVTALDLDRKSIQSSAELQLPNVTFGQFKADNQITIRGIGNDNLTIGGDPGVAYHQDGVYLTRGALASGGFFDVDRVEVLRGPQGTLYGRNAIGGVVNVISTQPTHQFEGHGDVTYGDYNQVRVRAAVNLPLTSTLALRVSGILDQNDGYVLNQTTGNRLEDTKFRGVRAILAWDPLSFYHAALEVVDEHQGGSGLIRRLLTPQTSPEVLALHPQPDPTDPFIVRHNVDDRQIVDHTGFYLTQQLNLKDGLTLKSISALNRSRTFQFLDLDDTSADYVNVSRDDRDKTWTQELQLTGDMGRIKWIVGAFYLDSFVHNYVPYIITPVGHVFFFSHQDTTAYAGFGQATYALTSRLRLTAGVRYSKERKALYEENHYSPVFFGLPAGGPDVIIKRNSLYHNDAVTPRFVAEYDVTSHVMLYGSVTRGFKSGGYNSSSLAPPYKPEFVWAYEGGVKSDMFDRRLRANLAGFYYDYSDLQVTAKQPGDAVFTISNAAQATVKGVELEVTAVPIPRLNIDVAVGYLDATYLKLLSADATRPTLGTLNLAGNSLPRSPHIKGSVGVQYAFELSGHGTLTPRADVSFQSQSYFSPFNLAVAGQGAYAKLNLAMTYAPSQGNWTIMGYVKNATNKYTVSDAIVGQSTSVSVYEGFYDPPRTYGVQIGFKF